MSKDVLRTTHHNIKIAKSARNKLFGGRVALGLLEGRSKARGGKGVLFHVGSAVELTHAYQLERRMEFTFVGGSYAKV